MTIRTPLAKVKGLGSAKNGTKHHINQRVTALFNIPLLLIFIFLIVVVTISPMQEIPEIVMHPFTILASIVFVINVFYHASLGLQMVAEDYIHSKCGLVAALVFIKGFCYLTIIAGIIAYLNLYFLFRSSF